MKLDGVKEYSAKKWENEPSTATPITAESLNHMEDGINDNSVAIKTIVESVSDDVSEDTNKIASMAALYSVKEAAVKIASAIELTNSDLTYKENKKLIPVNFETVLGYYVKNEFVEGQKSWNARLLRVTVSQGEKYKYYGYCDNVYGINYLDSDLNVVRQDTVTPSVEFEKDVIVPSGVCYIDFYSALANAKSYVLKYDATESLYKEKEGYIYKDVTSDLTVTNDKYFNPLASDYVNGSGMRLKEITVEADTLFRFSFVQHTAYSAYVDDFCIAPHIDYVNGTEVFREDIVVYVPKGKTLRINDYNSTIYNSKIEKIVEVSIGLPFITVASSEASSAIKSVCQYVCDGANDEVEIQNAIDSLASTGGRVFLTKGKYFVSAPIDTKNILIELCGEGALLDLREDTIASSDRGGTILQAVGNTDILHIGGAKGTTIHDIAFFGYGRNKSDNTSFGIKFTGYADTDRIYNCGFTNCAVAIGSNIATDVLYIHNLSVQRNKIGIALQKSTIAFSAKTLVWSLLLGMEIFIE